MLVKHKTFKNIKRTEGYIIFMDAILSPPSPSALPLFQCIFLPKRQTQAKHLKKKKKPTEHNYIQFVKLFGGGGGV